MTNVKKKASLGQKAAIAWQAFFHDKTSFPAKAVIIGALIYLFMPVDIVPDVIPLLGQTDDLGVVIAAVALFLRLSKAVREELSRQQDRSDAAAPRISQ